MNSASPIQLSDQKGFFPIQETIFLEIRNNAHQESAQNFIALINSVLILTKVLADHIGSTPYLRSTGLVPEAGLEPASLAAGDFESPASTSSATRAQ